MPTTTRTTRTRKPRAEYLRDKIAYHEAKLAWEYDQLAKIDPDFRPNFGDATPDDYDAFCAGANYALMTYALMCGDRSGFLRHWTDREYNHRSIVDDNYNNWIATGRGEKIDIPMEWMVESGKIGKMEDVFYAAEEATKA